MNSRCNKRKQDSRPYFGRYYSDGYESSSYKPSCFNRNVCYNDRYHESCDTHHGEDHREDCHNDIDSDKKHNACPCDVEHTIENLFCKLKEIGCYLEHVCQEISHPDYGMAHLSCDMHCVYAELQRLETNITSLNQVVDVLPGNLDAILVALNTLQTNLSTLQTEVSSIHSLINDPCFGSQQIKCDTEKSLSLDLC